jgi:(2Fe-2S) ferredoxin
MDSRPAVLAARGKRIFLCTNKRRRPLSCGRRCDTSKIARYLVRQLELTRQLTAEDAERAEDAEGTGGAGDTEPVEVVKTTCLGRCFEGPILAIYPDKAWYTYRDERDIAEIVAEYIRLHRPVTRLLIENIEDSAEQPRMLTRGNLDADRTG